MANVVIRFRDAEDGTVKITATFDPPLAKAKKPTPAMIYASSIMAALTRQDAIADFAGSEADEPCE